MTDRVAPQVAGYDVTALLGAGSGGEVWLGRDRRTGEPVAVKRVRPGAGLAARDRLRREAAALAGVTHPHVLRLRSVVGCLDEPDDLVLVLDAAMGGSLARAVARHGPRPPGQVVTVLVAVAEALAAVHRAGLAHGDVTPANVLVMADGRPVLGDLGSARLGGAGRSGERAGTPGFADPADRGGPTDPLASAGPPGDVHGLAATCVFALTGRPPYDASGARLPVAADPAARRLVAVLDAALDPDPGRRPDAAALARAGFEAAAAEPLVVDLLVVDPLVVDPLGAAPTGAGAEEGTTWGMPVTQVSAARWAAAPVVDQVRREDVPPPRRGRRRGAHARPRSVGPRPVGPRSVGPRPAGPAWSGWSALGRRGAAVLATAVAVALAAVTGIAWAGAGPNTSPGRDVAPATAGPQPSSPVAPAAATTPSPAGAGTPGSATGAGRLTPEHTWSARLRGLDAARSAAFAAGDADALGEVYAVGSPALRRDRRSLERLTAAGLRAEGVRLRAVEVRVAGFSPDEVRLAVTDVLAGYRLVDADSGRVVERRPGRGATRWRLTVTREPEGWRIWDIGRG